MSAAPGLPSARSTIQTSLRVRGDVLIEKEEPNPRLHLSGSVPRLYARPQCGYASTRLCCSVISASLPLASSPSRVSLPLSPRFPPGLRCLAGPNSRSRAPRTRQGGEKRPGVRLGAGGRAHACRLSGAGVKLGRCACPHFVEVAPCSEDASFREWVVLFFFFELEVVDAPSDG